MQSSLIGKIEKAQRYAQEPERITFTDFRVNFHGTNKDHATCYSEGKWTCSCDFYTKWGRCAHTMAMERILEKMLPEESLTNFEIPPDDC
ncbi:MAG: hypothetical protein FWF18_04190 [Dehalococcoidia bacterium]|nr:hypothetical protein [Dehalococcoidia bacterium]